MKNKKLIHDMLGCAYLAAHGNGDLDSDEVDFLTNSRHRVAIALASRDAVEHFEEHGDLETAITLSPYFDEDMRTTLEFEARLIDGELIGNPDSPVPGFLETLYLARGSLKSLEEATELERQQATKITDLFQQKITFYFCVQAACADGDLALGEDIALQHLCEAWGIDPMETLDWCNATLAPVLSAINGEDAVEDLFPLINEDNSFTSVATLLTLTVMAESNLSAALDTALAEALLEIADRFDFSPTDLGPEEVSKMLVEGTREALSEREEDAHEAALEGALESADEIDDEDLRAWLVETITGLLSAHTPDTDPAEPGILEEIMARWEPEEVSLFPIKGEKNSFEAFAACMATIVLMANQLDPTKVDVLTKAIILKASVFGFRAAGADPEEYSGNLVNSVLTMLSELPADDAEKTALAVVRNYAPQIQDQMLISGLLQQAIALHPGKKAPGMTLSRETDNGSFSLMCEALDEWGLNLTIPG